MKKIILLEKGILNFSEPKFCIPFANCPTKIQIPPWKWPWSKK